MGAQRLAGVVIVGVWTLARLYFWWKAGSRTVRTRAMPARRRAILLLISASLVPVYLYYVTPELDRFSVPVHPAVSWAGDAVLLVAVALFIWSHAALGRNWSVSVEVLESQQLVTTEPYHWVRHPMYSSLFLMAFGLVVATANPIASLPLLVSLFVMYLERVADEERLMLGEFGEQYAAYMQRTGRLLPRKVH